MTLQAQLDEWADDEPTIVEAQVPFSALQWEVEEPAYWTPPKSAANDLNETSTLRAVEG